MHQLYFSLFVSVKGYSASVVFLIAGSDDDDESEKEEKKWEDQQIQKAVKQVFCVQLSLCPSLSCELKIQK